MKVSIHIIGLLMSFVGLLQPCSAAGPVGGPVGAKVVIPAPMERPKLFLLESPHVNFVIHHGEGEAPGEGSLVISAYKDDRTSPIPVDLWLAGLVLRRDGELFDATIIRSVQNGEDLIVIVYIREKGMINAKVLHYVPEGHVLTLLKELDDLRGRNSVEGIRFRCAKFPDLTKYFVEAEKEKEDKK
jgi:hypothetical protein